MVNNAEKRHSLPAGGLSLPCSISDKDKPTQNIFIQI